MQRQGLKERVRTGKSITKKHTDIRLCHRSRAPSLLTCSGSSQSSQATVLLVVVEDDDHCGVIWE